MGLYEPSLKISATFFCGLDVDLDTTIVCKFVKKRYKWDFNEFVYADCEIYNTCFDIKAPKIMKNEMKYNTKGMVCRNTNRSTELYFKCI